MTSLYYDYNPNIDLRWDNDMYGQFENENSDAQVTNTRPANRKKSCKFNFNFKLFLRRLFWFILIVIIVILFVRYFKLYDGGSKYYPYIDLVNNKYNKYNKYM